jgi:hypothetical protein
VGKKTPESLFIPDIRLFEFIFGGSHNDVNRRKMPEMPGGLTPPPGFIDGMRQGPSLDQVVHRAENNGH